jgi:hypothetical protein
MERFMGDVLPPLLANGLVMLPVYLSGMLVLLGATVVGLLAVILSVSRVPVAGRWAAVLSVVASLGSFTTPLFYQRTLAGYSLAWRYLSEELGTLALLPLALSALALALAHRRLRRGNSIVSWLLLAVAAILATWSLYLSGLECYRYHNDPVRWINRLFVLQWAAVLVLGLVLLGKWANPWLTSR